MTAHQVSDDPPVTRAGAAARFPAPRARRAGFVLATGLLTATGTWLMLEVLRTNGLQPLELAVLTLFTLTFGWVAAAFCSAMIGGVLHALRVDPLSLRRTSPVDDRLPLWLRTAVVMPVYNEDVGRAVAGLEATYRDLEGTGWGRAFDFYLLSDSSDDAIAGGEREAVSRLAGRLATGAAGLFYRRRPENAGRKAGNIADFCRRWGTYDCLVVLDADSVMSGRTLCALVRAMQTNPRAGIIQTVPVPVRQRTLFGRGLQFAATLYSPMLAAGLAFWQLDSANYWGHNAIIRLAPFRMHCGLPKLPGQPPLGGEILSHDFVEAALMRRGGWEVLLLPRLGGSYEEVPGNILDYLKRDRRWSEGNLQHLRLLNARGLHPLGRLHFLLGAFAYGCSFLWLAMLLVGSVDAMSRALRVQQYFGSGPALFPQWPLVRVSEMWWLLGMVVVMLLLPKLFGTLACTLDAERRRAFGGAIPLLISAAAEMVLAVVIAPILMCFHAYFVTMILLGERVRWEPQSRDGRALSWRTSLKSSAVICAGGLLWGVLTHLVTPLFFWALSPVLLGLVLAGPILALTSRTGVGDAVSRLGLFRTPACTRPERVLRILEDALARAREPGAAAAPAAPVDPPPEVALDMPAQVLWTDERGPAASRLFRRPV